MTSYIPHTPQDIRRMLEVIGLPTLESLFDDVPENVREKRPLALAPGLSELELTRHMTTLAGRNSPAAAKTAFVGVGAYDHVIPAAVDALASREEFFTSYTPYQPEISQGTLQALFEYQTMICSLTGLQVSNASLYDAASAFSEAVRMAVAQTRRTRVLVSGGIHPHVRESMQTMLGAIGVSLEEIPLRNGLSDAEAFDDMIRPEAGPVAGVVLQSPNFLGFIENVAGFAGKARQAGALVIQGVMDALSLAVLRSPGESGADIAAGNGQGFGGGLSFGGPYFGFLTTTDALMRRLPGRIAGQSSDLDGKRAFVLTLQAREQHIRRDKATSNVCSNHSLYALRAAMYLSLLGPQGLQETAEACMAKARKLEAGLLSTGLFEQVSSAPYFREFTLRCRVDRAAYHRAMSRPGLAGGFDIAAHDLSGRAGWPGDAYIFCTTEKTEDSDIERFIGAVQAAADMPELKRGIL